jgi:hypothetical protein
VFPFHVVADKLSRPRKKVKILFYPCFPISERALLFGRFPGFVRSFFAKQHVDVECIWSNGGMILRGEPKYSEKNVSQCQFAHHKPHGE